MREDELGISACGFCFGVGYVLVASHVFNMRPEHQYP